MKLLVQKYILYTIYYFWQQRQILNCVHYIRTYKDGMDNDLLSLHEIVDCMIIQ